MGFARWLSVAKLVYNHWTGMVEWNGGIVE